ncbi:MAG: response regulator transcription factor [Verrucomicrobiae bacterium]|nr:response regulator transcription factor [Verrucomicrobiae bacterium]
MPTILVVDDEKDIRDLIVLNLQREGFKSIEAADGLEAAKLAKKQQPDLIILDLMLPQKDGISVFRQLRDDSRTSAIPVIMLTARGKLEEKISGLEVGADDYIIKPFSPRELMLRVRNLLRRTLGSGQSDVIENGDFRLDKKNLKLHLNEEPIDLTTTEFKLLLVLIDSPGMVKERAELLQKVWGYNDLIQTRTLDTHIKRLREKLGENGSRIETVRGVGYRFLDQQRRPDGE